jgi:hypothetical protein
MCLQEKNIMWSQTRWKTSYSTMKWFLRDEFVLQFLLYHIFLYFPFSFYLKKEIKFTHQANWHVAITMVLATNFLHNLMKTRWKDFS